MSADYTDLLGRLKRMAIPAHGDEEDTLLDAIRAIESLLKRPAADGADYAELEALLKGVLQFAVWGAGEGLAPCDDSGALTDFGPEEVLFRYATATGDEDYGTYPERIVAFLAGMRKQRDEAKRKNGVARESRDFWRKAAEDENARATSLEAQLAEGKINSLMLVCAHMDAMRIDREQAAEVFRVAWKMQQEKRAITYDHGNKIIDAVCQHGDFFSAALALYEALEYAVDNIDGIYNGNDLASSVIRDAGRAALAKARGEQP